MALYLPHEQRVVDEFRELAERTNKLANFQLTTVFAKLPELERSLLIIQLNTMRAYITVLGMRIQLFDQAAATRAPYSS